MLEMIPVDVSRSMKQFPNLKQLMVTDAEIRARVFDETLENKFTCEEMDSSSQPFESVAWIAERVVRECHCHTCYQQT